MGETCHLLWQVRNIWDSSSVCVHSLYLCWEQELAGQSDLRLQVGVNVFVSEHVCEKLKTWLFTGKTFPSASRARWMDSIKLKGGGKKVGHQTRQVTFMSALVMPLIALLDRKWPVWLSSFPRLKCLYNYPVDWMGTPNVWGRCEVTSGTGKTDLLGKKNNSGVFGVWKSSCNNVLMLLLLILLARDHILVCTCIANFECLVWPLLGNECQRWRRHGGVKRGPSPR